MVMDMDIDRHQYGHVSYEENDLQQFTTCSMEYTACKVEYYLYLIGAPILILISLTGNSMTLAVMCRPKLRRSATAVFISALAISDTVANTTGLIRHFLIRLSHVDIRSLSLGACRIQRFILYVSLDTSSWILALVTIERYLAVCQPLTHKKVRRSANAFKGVAAVFLFQVAFNIHVFFTRGEQIIVREQTNGTNSSGVDVSEYIICGYSSPTALHYWTYIQTWLSMLIYCIIPFLVMLTLNTLIIRRLRSMSDKSLVRYSSQASQTGVTQQTKSMTYMLLSVTIYFIIVTTPVFIYTMIESIVLHRRTVDGQYYATLELVDAVTTLLFYLNHSINFFLYCLTGRRFRRELKSMCGCMSAFKNIKSSIRGVKPENEPKNLGVISITAADERKLEGNTSSNIQTSQSLDVLVTQGVEPAEEPVQYHTAM